MSDKERHTIQCDGRGGILERMDDRPLSHRIVVGGQEVGVSNGARRHIAEQLGLAPSDGSPMPEGLDWPRVDGEPVVPGDRLTDLGDGETFTVKEIRFAEAWGCDGVVEGRIVGSIDGGGRFIGFCIDSLTRVKPVMDRDGVTIEVGDTVYWFDGAGAQLKVVDVRSSVLQIHIETEDGFRGAVAPTSLTHKRPLKTADGKLIEVGRIYYGDTDGVAWRVLGLDGPKGFPVRCVKDGGNAKRDLKPEWLHAERPDSWERLEEDAGKSVCEYFGSEYCECGGCPHEMDPDCNVVMALDIVRRAKALAGVVDDE